MQSGWRWKELLQEEDAVFDMWRSDTGRVTVSDRLSKRLSEKVSVRSGPTRIRASTAPRDSWSGNSNANRERKNPVLIENQSAPLPVPRMPAQKRIPVVLVHGFGGWSREEMGGQFFYWGGFQDIAQKMMDSNPGLVVLTAAVGPFSSVWDRAVELFYQLKGGTVDYGAVHAKEHGHDRWGGTEEGLYPEWDADHPVHIIGHSMGGLTARALVQLLADNADVASAMRSVVSTTLAMSLGLMGLMKQHEVVYDFKLHQWGVAPRGPYESWSDYYSRVTSARVFSEGSKDLSEFDLTLEGAVELNTWVRDHPQVYYFSYESRCTFASPLAGADDPTHLPVFSTRAIFLPTCFLLGQGLEIPDWAQDQAGGSAAWRPNDGMVSCCSQRAPTYRLERRLRGEQLEAVRRGSAVVDHARGRDAGVWNFLGRLDELDHLACIGWTDKTVWDFNSFMGGHVHILEALAPVHK